MKRWISIYILMCIALFSCTNERQRKPVVIRSSPEAVALLNKIYKIQGKSVISGQHNYPHELNRSTDSTKVLTGKTPLIWGADMGEYDSDFRVNTIAEAKKKYEEGFIVTLMWHEAPPITREKPGRKGAWYAMDQQEWQNILTPGTEDHTRWLADIDAVAESLKQLRDANIPVLWRPYHEMNGIWFWWGNRRGENGFKKLWRMMFERFTDYHKLNNLIWVWNANAPRDWENDEAFDYDLFYPGHEYVDILAADVYKNDYKQSHHDDLVKLASGRPIALGEVGIAPTPEILDQQKMWTWFMIWARFNWTDNSPESLKSLHDNPRTINWENSKQFWEAGLSD